MLRFLTAGESHGRAIGVIVEGLPAGLPFTVEELQGELARRRLGFGRGPRMHFERDDVAILGGVRHGRTLGSPVLIEIARRELSRAGLSDQVQLLVAPATQLPFPDGRFDVVVTSHVIKHLDDQAMTTAFSELVRVLRPGGRFLMWEFKKSPLSVPLFWSARTSGLPPPFKLRDRDTLAQALTRAGFSQVAPVPTGIFLLPPVPRMALLAQR